MKIELDGSVKKALATALRGVIAVVLALAGGSTVSEATDTSLTVGDRAPTLSGVRWLGEQRYDTWEQGTIYVVQFWAPWCLPCLAEMPELSTIETTMRVRGVRIVGVAVMKKEKSPPIEEFLASRDDIAYAMAEDVDKAAEERLMIAAKARNLPMLMLIDGKGRLVWAGPGVEELELRLTALLEGNFDLDDAIAADVVRQKFISVREKAAVAEQANDWGRAAELYEEMAEVDDKRYGWALVDAYQTWLAEVGDHERAEAAMAKFRESIYWNRAPALVVLVSRIVKKIPKEMRDLDLALEAASRAASMDSPVKPRALRFLVHVHTLRDEPGEAASALEALIDVAPEKERAELLEALQSLRKEAVAAATRH